MHTHIALNMPTHLGYTGVSDSGQIESRVEVAGTGSNGDPVTNTEHSDPHNPRILLPGPMCNTSSPCHGGHAGRRRQSAGPGP
jgi:hypothetical protein